MSQDNVNPFAASWLQRHDDNRLYIGAGSESGSPAASMAEAAQEFDVNVVVSASLQAGRWLLSTPTQYAWPVTNPDGTMEVAVADKPVFMQRLLRLLGEGGNESGESA